jgi:hypothetical protein
MRRSGGSIGTEGAFLSEEDNRPAELRKMGQAVFSDPDGNEFELLQVVC